MEKLAILIPIYNEIPLWYEKISLKTACNQFKNYKLILVCKNSFKLKEYYKIFYENNCPYSIVRFGDKYFTSKASYNELLMSNNFYLSFKEYEYILICQTDVYVFRNNIESWINNNYYYIGAPWLYNEFASNEVTKNNIFKRQVNKFLKYKFNAVGNGGFSLRNVELFNIITERLENTIKNYKKNEDFFFSFEAPKYFKNLKIPTTKQALKFAFDENPELAYKLNHLKLPMAAHAWHRNITFWKNFIKEIGS